MTRQQQQQEVPTIFEEVHYAISWLQALIDMHGLNQDLLQGPWVTYHIAVEALHAGRQDYAIRCAEFAFDVTMRRLIQADAQVNG